MRIGILSVNMHTKGLNFACPVHTYAFQQFLLANHIESEVIDYEANYYDNFNPRYPSEYYKEKCENLKKRPAATQEELEERDQKLAEMEKKRDAYAALYEERAVRYDKFQEFIEKYYIKTGQCYNSDLFEVIDPGFDCYICATDVVWKNNPNVGFDRGYFLASSCMENKWKLAYAASRGVPKPYTEEEQRLFFHQIEDIDWISVREASLKQFIEENSDRKAELVIDPVLFHDGDFYRKITKKPEEEHYILFYYAEERSKNALNQAIRYAKKYHLKIVELTNLPIKEGVLGGYDDVESVFRYDVGPDEWLGYIQYADYVFTNSFHACCFGILFEKKFFIGSRHGDKIANLLQTFGLSDRNIEDTDLAPAEEKEIDYAAVRKILKEKREESCGFLLNAIHEAQKGKKEPRDYESYKRTLTYPILYNSKTKSKNLTWTYQQEQGAVKTVGSGTREFTPRGLTVNDGTGRLLKNEFRLPGHRFVGWNIRFRIDNYWFYYLADGSLKLKKDYRVNVDPPLYLFGETEAVPFLPVNRISVMVAEAVWEEKNGAKVKKFLKKHTDPRIKNFIKKHIR